MSAENAYALLESIAKLSGTVDKLQRLTPEGHEILDEEVATEIQEEAKERRSPFSFLKSGIPIDAEITFVDDATITAVVSDDRHIVYKGKTTSVSALAQQLKGYAHAVQGTLWFTYHGKLLRDIRLEREEQGLYQ